MDKPVSYYDSHGILPQNFKIAILSASIAVKMDWVRKSTEGALYVLFIAARAQKVGYQSKQVFSQAKVDLLF